MLEGFGQQAIINMLVHLVFIAISFWALQALNFDKFLRASRIFQARLLFILMSIALGSLVGNFFLNYLMWAQQLPFILQTVTIL
jgi:uncharacterized integral membrane protein (TIGR02327 family)